MTNKQNPIQSLQQAVLCIMEYEQNLFIQSMENGDTITPIDVARKLTEYGKILEDMGMGDSIPIKRQSFDIQDGKSDYSEEINKVKNRLPRWKRKPHQKNSQIVQAYFDCKKNCEKVYEKHLYTYCTDELGMERFYINFTQMCNISPKNHGKVFDIKQDGEIVLWEPVAEYIRKVWQQS